MGQQLSAFVVEIPNFPFVNKRCYFRHLHPGASVYYISTEIYSVQTHRIKSLSLMRGNLIGHTIFLTSEKYRMTNQKPDAIFFTSEKIRIGFSLSGRSCGVIEWIFATFPAFPKSWLQGLQTLIVQFRIRHDRWIKALTTHLYRVSLDLK